MVILLLNILWSSIFFSVISPAVLTQPWLWKISAIILYITLFYVILSIVWHYFQKDVNQCLFTPGKELKTENRSNTAKAQARVLMISLDYLQKHGRLKAPIVYPIMGDNWWAWKCWNSLHSLWASDKSDSFSSAELHRLTTSRLEGLDQSSEFLGLAATCKLFISCVLRSLP